GRRAGRVAGILVCRADRDNAHRRRNLSLGQGGLPDARQERPEAAQFAVLLVISELTLRSTIGNREDSHVSPSADRHGRAGSGTRGGPCRRAGLRRKQISRLERRLAPDSRPRSYRPAWL